MRGWFRCVLIAAAAALLPVAGAGAAIAGGGPALRWAPVTSPGSYSYGTVAAGQQVSQVFTLTDSGGSYSGLLTITLTGSAAFSKTADTCSGISLHRKHKCSVTVQYTPAAPGQADTATLAASSRRGATASLALAGMAAKVSPAITTTPGPGVPAGGTVTDQATLTGGSGPTGMITFSLYGPSSTADCTGTPVDTESVTVSGDGSYATPTGAAPAQAGTYWWTASYGGDGANNAAASTCGDESVTIGPRIYWADQGSGGTTGTIMEANPDGTGVTALVTGQFAPTGVTADASHIYWTDAGAGTVMRANLNGTGVTTLVSGQQQAGGMAVDASYIYWTGNTTIMRAALDGSGVTALVSGQSEPTGVAVDGSHVYWNDFSPGAIMQANLDGSGVTSLVPGQSEPSGVAVDGSHVYWSEYNGSGPSGLIREAGLDGSGATTLVSGQTYPWGVAVDAGHIYWVDQTTGTIMRANLDGTGAAPLISGLSDPLAVAVSQP